MCFILGFLIYHAQIHSYLSGPLFGCNIFIDRNIETSKLISNKKSFTKIKCQANLLKLEEKAKQKRVSTKRISQLLSKFV